MEQEYYRTFIALPVTAGPELISVAEGLRHVLSGERISWVKPDNFHFTLRFLGETPADRVGQIGEALKSGIHATHFRLRMTHPDRFGPRKRPRVLYVGIRPSPELIQVRDQVENILENCGWPALADQPFRAHLTLGRIRSLKDPDALERALHRCREMDPGQLIMEKLVYFRSILGPAGPVYSPIAQVNFDGTA